MLRTALIALTLWAPACSCGQDAGNDSVVVVTFGDRCGGADGCDLDLSCLGAVSIRAWTPEKGLQTTCLRGDDLAGLERGCDLGSLDVSLALDVEQGPLVVELLGLSSDDCAPAQDAEASILFEGIATLSAVGQPIEIALACGAGCAAGLDPCEDADSCDCCAGVCVDEDEMMHCGGCFDPCDPFRADRCHDSECLCGSNPACSSTETCCPDGTCAPIGECAETSCPFASDETCTNPATDEHGCGGGMDADSCSSSRSDACFAGGCSCGGGPACAEPAECVEGACVD